MDPNKTNTFLIAMLDDLLKRCAEPIEVFAVRTDHPTPDGSWEHSGGDAIDFYPRNWQGREQQAVVSVFKALAANPYCQQVGFGGVTQSWESYVTWPTQYFETIQDNSADHIHASCATSSYPPGTRATALGVK